ncbi:zinc-binding dehydrogenase [Alphaproteobacteria bacterium GH1-50]|uniref:Zinc-binding dehydrogenase n=1 Tax=Kangsaoukella pontilimi TaxID=2691042 RepID=A0A7C9MY33_9RHOB|nr:NADPH:quinone oxidoreductase family protein [Kangsaoukella pontilimi]MXQ06498.1 zinc-binding dehydrogenase [Kangsaoukella pontilimi]
MDDRKLSEKAGTRSWVVEAPSGAARLVDGQMPAPGEGEILIEVAATGLNFADLLIMKGTYQDTPPFPLTPGLEVAGRVIEVGGGVDRFTPGTRVLAYTGKDGLGTHLVTDARRVLALPDEMDDVTAAGFQIAYGTSHLALTRRARLQPGERLLVLGAAGGVGLTAVELGKALGARVAAVARGAERLEVARRAGADELIDPDNEVDLVDRFRAAGPFDVVYDAVGGAMGEAALRAVAPEARFLLIGFAGGEVTRLKANHILVKNTDVIGVHWGAYLNFAPEAFRQSLSELLGLYTEGRISPHVSHVLPLEKADDALALLRERKSTGKIVVTVSQ